jgi:hypothetical protein
MVRGTIRIPKTDKTREKTVKARGRKAKSSPVSIIVDQQVKYIYTAWIHHTWDNIQPS